MERKLFVVSMLVILVGATVAWGEPIAKEIYYQKKTTLAYPAIYTFRFSLWNVATGGDPVNKVWEEEKPVKITSAVIKTNLGNATPLDLADFSDQLWVQVERKKRDGSYVVIGTRDRLTASPYALNAGTNLGLLFVQQDVLPSFGQQEGVRLGVAKGIINGSVTTNFFFTVPPPGPPSGGPFIADDVALIIDPEGDQILFKVHSQGTVYFDTLDANVSLFRAPFLATYAVQGATGKLSKYEGLVFPAKGTVVISTLVFFGAVPGTPVGTVYVEVGRNPIQE